MKICILTDTHDNRTNLREIMARVMAEGVEVILHCGDVVAPSTLREVIAYDVPIHVIYGNNTGDLLAMGKMVEQYPQIHFYGQDADITLADKRIFLVHYPHYAQAMALTGRYDLVCCGHSHHASISTLQNIQKTTTTLVDAGNVAGIGEEPKYVVGDLSSMEFEIRDL